MDSPFPAKPPRSVPLSVRVSPEDADFISSVEIAGADTPSDKLRALLAEARKRHQSFGDYQGCLGMVQEMLSPELQRLRAAEHRERVQCSSWSRSFKPQRGAGRSAHE